VCVQNPVAMGSDRWRSRFALTPRRAAGPVRAEHVEDCFFLDRFADGAERYRTSSPTRHKRDIATARVRQRNDLCEKFHYAAGAADAGANDAHTEQDQVSAAARARLFYRRVRSRAAPRSSALPLVISASTFTTVVRGAVLGAPADLPARV